MLRILVVFSLIVLISEEAASFGIMAAALHDHGHVVGSDEVGTRRILLHDPGLADENVVYLLMVSNDRSVAQHILMIFLESSLFRSTLPLVHHSGCLRKASLPISRDQVRHV